VPVLLACLLLHLAWAIAMPVASGPDEPAHVYRAVSLWEGQFLPSTQAPDGEWFVRVPPSLAGYSESGACSRDRPDAPPRCGGSSGASEPLASVTTGAGRYLPTYYYTVGWAGRLFDGAAVFYAMRVTSLLVSSLLLALAITTFRGTVGRGWAAIVLPLAVTPQVLWLGSIVNPNSWEVDAGILTWAAGLALASNLSAESRRSLWAKFLLGASLLLLTRRLSPLWLVLIVAGVLAVRWCMPMARRAGLPSIHSRPAVVVLPVLVLLAVFSVWWHLTLDLGTVGGVLYPQQLEGGRVTLHAVLPDVANWLRETYGLFGWLNTGSPVYAVVIWFTVGAWALVLVTLGSGRRRRVAAALGIAIGLCAAIPLALELTTGAQVGIHFWQARYTMPYSQGIPLAAAVIGVTWQSRQPELGKLLRVAPFVAALLWPVLGTLTFLAAVRDTTAWSPGGERGAPGGAAWLVALVALGAAALVWAVRQEAPEGGSRIDGDPVMWSSRVETSSA
jgi:hypothetical protein